MKITTSSSTWLLDSHHFCIGREIGRGSFGAVFQGTYFDSDVAVKQITSAANANERGQAAKHLRNEVKTLSLCRHKNIVRLVGACVDPPTLVMDLAPNGTLRDLLDRHEQSSSPTSLTPLDRLNLALGVCNGMAMAHSQNILHLDLKSTNILIGPDQVPWVADFGLSVSIRSSLSCGVISTNGGRGTMQYMAPELFKTKRLGGIKYEKPCDVYSFAMLVWEIFSGKVPFCNMPSNEITSMHLMVLMGQDDPERPPMDAIPPEIMPIIEACWQQEPASRPTFSEVREMLTEALSSSLFSNDTRKETKKKKFVSFYRIDVLILVKLEQ